MEAEPGHGAAQAVAAHHRRPGAVVVQAVSFGTSFSVLSALYGEIHELQTQISDPENRFTPPLREPIQVPSPKLVFLGDRGGGHHALCEYLFGIELGEEFGCPLVLRFAWGSTDRVQYTLTSGELSAESSENFEDIRASLRAEVARLAPADALNDTALDLRITSRSMPDITAVLLPGLVSDPPPSLERSRSIAQPYIADPDALLVVCHPGNIDLANSRPLRQATNVDFQGARTLLVYMIPDEDPNANSSVQYDQILRHMADPTNFFPIGVAIVPVRCRPKAERGVSFVHARQVETREFELPVWRGEGSSCGVGVLARHIMLWVASSLAASMQVWHSQLKRRARPAPAVAAQDMMANLPLIETQRRYARPILNSLLHLVHFGAVCVHALPRQVANEIHEFCGQLQEHLTGVRPTADVAGDDLFNETMLEELAQRPTSVTETKCADVRAASKIQILFKLFVNEQMDSDTVRHILSLNEFQQVCLAEQDSLVGVFSQRAFELAISKIFDFLGKEMGFTILEARKIIDLAFENTTSPFPLLKDELVEKAQQHRKDVLNKSCGFLLRLLAMQKIVNLLRDDVIQEELERALKDVLKKPKAPDWNVEEKLCHQHGKTDPNDPCSLAIFGRTVFPHHCRLCGHLVCRNHSVMAPFPEIGDTWLCKHKCMEAVRANTSLAARSQVGALHTAAARQLAASCLRPETKAQITKRITEKYYKNIKHELAQLIEQAVQVLLVDEVANRMEDALITAIFRPHGMSEDEINRHIGTLLHRRDSNAVRAAAAGVADPRFQSLTCERLLARVEEQIRRVSMVMESI